MIKKLLLLAFSGLLLSGCLSPFEKPAAPDLTGKFDGLWQVVTSKERTSNDTHNGSFFCSSGALSGYIHIDEGMVYFLGEKPTKGMVDSTGVFYAKIFGARNVIHLAAHLDQSQGSGTYINGYQGSTNGCNSSAVFTRLNDEFSRRNAFTAHPINLVNEIEGKATYHQFISRDFTSVKGSLFVLKSEHVADCYGMWWQTKNHPDELTSHFQQDLSLAGGWRASCPDGVSYKGVWGWSDSAHKGHFIGVDNQGHDVVVDL